MYKFDYLEKYVCSSKRQFFNILRIDLFVEKFQAMRKVNSIRNDFYTTI